MTPQNPKSGFNATLERFDPLRVSSGGELTPGFRLRVLELHRALQEALIHEGGSLTITHSSNGDGGESVAWVAPRTATLEIRDTDPQSGSDVTVALELENGRCVDLMYPRDNLKGIPSDVLAWALLRDIDRSIERGD